MGTLFRSQPMVLINLFFSVEAAHDIVDELARIGVVQFRDLNPQTNAFQRNFVNDVRRVDELEKKLFVFEEKMIEHGIRSDFYYPEADMNADQSLSDSNSLTVLSEMESQFEELVQELQQLDQFQLATRRDITAALEEKAILERAHRNWLVGSEGFVKELTDEEEEIHLLGGEQRSTNLSFVAGVINSADMNAFRRILWRATHGNLFMRDDEIDEPIPDPKKKTLVRKSAFIIFSQGEVTQNKIRKMCEAFNASLFPISSNQEQRSARILELERRIEDLTRVYAVNVRRTKDILGNTVLNRYDAWRCRILKEKLIYHTMNLFDYDIQRTTLIAEGWCPEQRIVDVQTALTNASQKSRALFEPVLHVLDSKDTPPTYFELNKYTRAFQAIVDAYGVPDYQEVNPTPFNIVSFPFLFGVMFGDLGHAAFLLMFALFLVLREEQLSRVRLNELIKMAFDGRYVLVLMGFFAAYMGLLYNEVMGVPMNLFGVKFFYFGGETTYLQPYPVGVNPIWKVADNTLLFYNSLKMKMSIIIGVLQMTFGICLSAFNASFFRRHWEHKYDMWLIFVPQLIFFMAIFGYMAWLIIFKWCVNWMNVRDFQAPKLLSLLISMFGAPTSYGPNDIYHMYNGQGIVQLILLLSAVISVPWMLIIKPLMLRRDWRNAHPNWRELEAAKEAKEAGHAPEAHDPADSLIASMQVKKIGGAQYQKLDGDHSDSDGEHDHHHHHHDADHVVAISGGGGSGSCHVRSPEEDDEFEFGEVFVHNMIHSIEFILGAISNTASYLRLWALSLAHSELAEVFLSMIGLLSVKINIFISPWIGFGAWAGLTVAVLLGMEAISSFLHALRLHWVEFMNKFYHGTGYPFEPVAYATQLVTPEGD